MSIKGYPTQTKDERLSAQFATVEPVRTVQNGLSVVAHQFVFEAATDAVEAGSSTTTIVATAHAAQVGDVIRFTSGALSGKEAKVYSVSANAIVLAEDLASAPVAAVTFQVLRHKYPEVESDGRVKISGSFTTSEQAVAEPGDPIPTDVKVIGGSDSGTTRAIAVDAAGQLQVDVLSSALPSGAATSAIQTDGSQKTQIVDGSGNVISSTANALDVNLKSPITVDVSLDDANDSVLVYGFDGSANQPIKTDASGDLQVDVLSSALPTGAATESTLASIDASMDIVVSTINSTASQRVSVVSNVLASNAATETSLSSINSKVPPRGQAPMVNSTPVVIASDQTAVPITGSVTATNDANGTPGSAIPSEATMVGGSDGTNLRALKTDASGELQIDVLSSALPTGAATESTLSSLNGKVTACNTGAVTVSSSVLPTGAATSAAQTDGTQKTQLVDAAGDIADVKLLSAALATTDKGLVTNTIMHGESTASPGTYVDVKVNPSGALTVEADVTSSVLPTGAATEATLAGVATETTVSAISGKLPATLGQTTMANSLAVVIASDQASIPVTASVSTTYLSVVDLLDAGILDTSSTNIPGSASSPVQVVASLAAAVKALQLLDTTGAFVGVYTGGVGVEVLQFVMGPGSDQTIEHAIPSGSRVSLKRLDSTTAVSSGIVAINFLG